MLLFIFGAQEVVSFSSLSPLLLVMSARLHRLLQYSTEDTSSSLVKYRMSVQHKWLLPATALSAIHKSAVDTSLHLGSYG